MAKVTTKGFRIVEGYRLNSGVTFTVDKNMSEPVDLIGKRISDEVYKTYFAPPKKKTETLEASTEETTNEE